MVLTYEGLAEAITPDAILERVLAAVPVPRIDLARGEASFGGGGQVAPRGTAGQVVPANTSPAAAADAGRRRGAAGGAR
jgi:hypothetical protein